MELVIKGESLEGSGESTTMPGSPSAVITGKRISKPGVDADQPPSTVLRMGRGSLIADNS